MAPAKFSVPVRLAALVLLSVLTPARGLAQNAADPVAMAAVLKQAIQTLEIDTATFVMDWNAAAGDCNAVRDSLLGNMKAPCRKVRAALRRGTLLQFQLDCFNEGARIANRVLTAPDFAIPAFTAGNTEASVLFQYQLSLTQTCNLAEAGTGRPDFIALLTEAYQAPASGFDRFGPTDSMAWWRYNSDPASYSGANTGSGFGAPGGPVSLPTIGARPELP